MSNGWRKLVYDYYDYRLAIGRLMIGHRTYQQSRSLTG